MPRFPSLINIAGVDLSGCRGLLIDGDQFADSERGSVAFGIDSTPNVQTIDTLHKGVAFGLTLAPEDDSGIAISRVNAVIAAVKTARSTVGYFTFDLINEQYQVHLRATPDYNQVWYKTSGKYSDGYTNGVEFRFIVVQAVSVSLS